MMTIHRRSAALVVGASLLAVALAACGTSGSIEVTEAWARTSPAMAEAGAAYMLISNGTGTDDALVGVSVGPTVAATAEIHETVAMGPETDESGGHMAPSTTGAHMMEMRPVNRLDIPAGESVTLAPGGYHIMLLGLASPLEAGSTIEIVLTFEQAGEVVVTTEVRDTAP